MKDKRNKPRKIAIFHNYMDNIGGAEIVTLILARELNADIYTTNIDKKKIKKMGFKTNNIYSIGKIPINAPFRQQSALRKFRKLNLKNKHDYYIIAGDWAMSGAVKNKPNLWHVHSPIREIWDLYEYTRNNILPAQFIKSLNRYVFDIWVRYNRYLNLKYLKQVNKITCDSKNVQKRIKKYLKKDAAVIHPPTETSKFRYIKNGNYWLSVNRLINHKRVDIQLKTFQKLPDEKLIIVGSYEKSDHFKQYMKYIKRIKPKNVEILHWVDQDKLIELYAKCRGFITTSQNEDYGLTPVEAMASGKFVIAPNEGGYKETIINGKTGMLIDSINEDKLIEAIKSVKNPEKYKDDCIKQAEKFDTKIFIRRIKGAIENEI